VVSECDRVRAGREQLLRELRGQAGPVRGVLPVDDADVDRELFPDAGQASLDRPATR
jgi:hypothetical protein